MCVYVRLMLGVFFYCSPPYILRQGLLLKLELTHWPDWLISEFHGSCLLLPSTGIADTYQHYWLFRNVGDPNSDPHACTESTSPMKLSPQPIINKFVTTTWVELWRLSRECQRFRSETGT